MFKRIKDKIVHWLVYEPPNTGFPLCDFERIRYEVRLCDVLLVEGRSRISNVIKKITQSPWSHACIYIGRIHDIDDAALREKLKKHFKGDPDVQLVVEGYLGQGTIVSPLDVYQKEHIRICRPRGLSRKDAQKVAASAINKLGSEYDTRQIIDLFRFLLPWSILPRRWGSSLFARNAGQTTKTVCSTMIAKAFASIDFPILPVVRKHEETGIELFERNPRLFVPCDFDYSPYFDIAKYPFISFSNTPYRDLPWNPEGRTSQDGLTIIDPTEPKETIIDKIKEKKEKIAAQKTHNKEKSKDEDKKNDMSSAFNILSNRFPS